VVCHVQTVTLATARSQTPLWTTGAQHAARS
jgi:hypothetical protein